MTHLSHLLRQEYPHLRMILSGLFTGTNKKILQGKIVKKKSSQGNL